MVLEEAGRIFLDFQILISEDVFGFRNISPTLEKYFYILN